MNKHRPIPVGGFAGIAIYVNPNMSPGTVEFRDYNGETLGWIFNIGEVHIAQAPATCEQSEAEK